jgi:hypothetical protein
MADKATSQDGMEVVVPESLVGSRGEFERSKGIHLLAPVAAPPDGLPPPAAVTVQPAAQDSSPAQSAPPPASSDASD